jgi:hypothetical protein
VVGNKIDLGKLRDVQKEEAEKFASQIRAPYVETSALSGVGHDEVFKIAILESRKRRSKFRLDIFAQQSNTSAGCQCLIF